MPTFRHLPISRRLWLIVLVAVAMLLAMSVLLLRQSYDDLYAGKVLKTQHVVESVQGILKHQHALQQARIDAVRGQRGQRHGHVARGRICLRWLPRHVGVLRGRL